MNIYTSYWAQVRHFPQNLVGLNTTVWPPRWRPLGKDKRGVWVVDCPPLHPGKECAGLCNGKCEPRDPDHCAFLMVYYDQLMRIDMENFLNHLKVLHDKICEGENFKDVDFALITFETPANLCSERWPLINWLNYYGIHVKEWQPNI